nr:MAG TPA: hypothetical protein [Caudoviricetes sp.]
MYHSFNSCISSFIDFLSCSDKMIAFSMSAICLFDIVAIFSVVKN